MRILFLLLAVSIFASTAAPAQQSPQNYAPQTHAPQTYAPQTYAPQTYAPPGYTPQNGDAQARPTPRTRLVKCMMSQDPNDFCVFYSERAPRRGSPCSCGGARGSAN